MVRSVYSNRGEFVRISGRLLCIAWARRSSPFGRCVLLYRKRGLFIGQEDLALFVEVDFDEAGFFAPGRLVVIAEIGTPPVAVFVFEIIAILV
jgi:hypothetical protein